ncbi:phosphoethanolamine transferase [Myroides sp. WP-1]|uniref:phosphoethanolamine transferase n=1 Tax=Myroides sp. WP-1 TaxID=2759944 RepID=UPI0015FD48D6|nr:phosphoethanolamine transferase [Myroides sp. WP-1]MBB1139513.1 lipid A phosphoethanolamine transferase [Myroides sp. WP-1]
MREKLQKRNLLKRIGYSPIALFCIYLFVNMVPTFYFTAFQPLNILGRITVFVFPLSLYLLVFSLFKNMGRIQVLLFPVLFIHAFQIVLFYLFGEDVIAVDMYLNVATTNATEITELLGSLLPSIAFVCLLYIPTLIWAILQWRRKIYLPKVFRHRAFNIGVLLFFSSFVLSLGAQNKNREAFSFTVDVYPINAYYNLHFAVNKWKKVNAYPQTSKNFVFEATKMPQDSVRQIIILVVGETGRAHNWQLYGYDRPTNPLLSKQEHLVLFEDALTQSNTTHKSVSMILSDVNAASYRDIYYRKGIAQAFKEAGFTTICLSNQSENNSFIEYFTKEADIYKTIRTTDSKTRLTVNHPDEELIPLMTELIEQQPGNLFIILHSYGSHFNYKERYPKAFRQFTPDNLTAVSRRQKEQLVNTYDNSILYTDYFLSTTLDALQTVDAQTMLLYTSDHGEDLFDDDRGLFLHSSPTPSYYQLHIPFFLWFSNSYIDAHPTAYQLAKNRYKDPINTQVIFHTLLDAAAIQTPYFKPEHSLVNPQFKVVPRLYLNDHDLAVPYQKMNLKKEDFEQIEKLNLKK